MTSKWVHLPNAKHIDRVLASVGANTGAWASIGTDSDIARGHAYDTAWSIAYNTARFAVFNAVCAAAKGTTSVSPTKWSAAGQNEAYYAAKEVMIALIAYEDSAHLLDSTPEEIKLLHALGHPCAILFLPAAIAFQQINELT